MRGIREAGLALSAVAICVAGLLAAQGCSAILGVESDRHVVVQGDTGDFVPDVGAPDAGVDAAVPVGVGPWDCLGHTVPNDPSTQVDLSVLLFDPLQSSTAAGSVDGGSDLDTVNYTPLPGVALQLCAVRDPNCSAPSPTILSDDAGIALFRIQGDFVGFFELSRDDLLPASFYPGKLLANQATAVFPTYDFTPSGFRALAGTVTTSPLALDRDGGLGHAFITIYDCQDHQAAGVSLTIDNSTPQTVLFYTENGLPTSKAKQTDNFGLTGAVNVPVGSLTVHATLAATLVPIGTANIIIRPGAITFAWVRARTL
jgi:hypothetical protein